MSLFLQNVLSWIRIQIRMHLFFILDPDPNLNSEKLLDPDAKKMNADPQP